MHPSGEPQAIYLDHNATSPLDPAVFELMTRLLGAHSANASSVHRAGQRARAHVDEAREQLALAIGASPKEIVFTSGGTEANNLALRGVFARRQAGRARVVVSAVEHPAILETAAALGGELVRIPVDSGGGLSLEALSQAIDADTALVSVMWVNNETGVIHPVHEIGLRCRQHGVPFHVDAVQALGRLPIDLSTLPVDLMSFSAHKIYGPQGAGALWSRSGLALLAQSTGGHQERGRRAGTENVAAIAGFGLAAQLASERLHEMPDILRLREHLEQALRRMGEVLIVGAQTPRVANTVTACFAGVEGEALLMGLDLAGISVSSGSACTSGSLEPSHVLRAMGIEERWSRGAIRFSLGRHTTRAQLDELVRVLEELLSRLR